MIKVLIVDDSNVARLHLRHLLEADGIRVIGMAEDGLQAVRFVQEHKTDVVVMDINMPNMNGLEATRMIMETRPTPIVIVSATYSKKDDIEKSFLAMEAGALAILEKPSGGGHPDSGPSAREFVQTVKLMSEVKVVKRWSKTRVSKSPESPLPETPEQALKKIRLVAIGASTGGPPVLHTILSGIQKGFPLPVIIVQHIAKGFLEGLVDWLAQTTQHPVHIAKTGEELKSGHFYFAPDDYHIGVDGSGKVVLSKSEPENGIRPSISYLFRSAMDSYGGEMVGILLTGMGKDGSEELRQLKNRGAVTIVQDKESSVVFGMPGEAIKIDAATYILPPERISATLENIAREVN